jgi:hypothetical protein
MTNTTIAAREEIRAVAKSHGWESSKSGLWHDTFLRPAELGADSVLAGFFVASGHSPLDKVFVGYDYLGRVIDASWATPGQQSALLGYHVGSTDITGTGKRAQVLQLLTEGLPS